jgi:hypothetical protein
MRVVVMPPTVRVDDDDDVEDVLPPPTRDDGGFNLDPPARLDRGVRRELDVLGPVIGGSSETSPPDPSPAPTPPVGRPCAPPPLVSERSLGVGDGRGVRVLVLHGGDGSGGRRSDACCGGAVCIATGPGRCLDGVPAELMDDPSPSSVTTRAGVVLVAVAATVVVVVVVPTAAAAAAAAVADVADAVASGMRNGCA